MKHLKHLYSHLKHLQHIKQLCICASNPLMSLQDVHDCYLDLFQTHLHFVSNNPTGLTYQVSFISTHNPFQASGLRCLLTSQDWLHHFIFFIKSLMLCRSCWHVQPVNLPFVSKQKVWWCFFLVSCSSAINHHFYVSAQSSTPMSKRDRQASAHSISQNTDDGKCNADRNTSLSNKVDLSTGWLIALYHFGLGCCHKWNRGGKRNAADTILGCEMIFFAPFLSAGNSSIERTHHLQPTAELQPQSTPGICLSNKR